MSYDFRAIERKWQDEWQKKPVAQTKPASSDQKKYYCLDMFPYPSGSGLHVGHWRGYVLSDVYARIKWLQGYNVLHPMGWDAFGLPAENDAIKKGTHPKTNTAHNIANFKKQLQAIAAIYDWDKELNTTDPHYYKWTQWIFLQMYKAGLAYEDFAPINWCPSCLTGLANEEVTNNSCERCGSTVVQKEVRQWMLKITAYAQKLLDGLDTLEWPDKVKTMQRNWIGRSEGAHVTFTATAADGATVPLPVYTTCPETIFGVTFMVVAPEHELVKKLVTPDQAAHVKTYLDNVASMSAIDRASEKHKTGVFTGSYATNPANNKQIPIYVASYVLAGYGTGIVMGVPGHDERDFDFAVMHGLPRIPVIQGPDIQLDTDGNMQAVYACPPGDGPLINSGQFDGLMAKSEGVQKITDWLVAQGVAERTVNYRLRDWIFSRQRYWGEPIPLIHCATCGVVPVPEDQLPVELPDVEKYQPTGTGESPLAAIDWWVNTTCPTCSGPAKRETNTMPQWAGSCWYFLRYPNPHLEDKPFSAEDMQYWLPVDLYVGGIEHAILHLLYARFYVKVLHDLGYVPFNEPFSHLFNQGMVCKYSEKSGHVEKMSKSKGNVVNPDEIVQHYGSDVLRLYMLFMGPPELDCEWQDNGLEGIRRFLNRLWTFATDSNTVLPDGVAMDDAVLKHVHIFLKEFQERLERFKPNTAISAAMEFVNAAIAGKWQLSKDMLQAFFVTLSTMAPHMMSELLQQVCGTDLASCAWPTYDPKLAVQDTVTIAVQVNNRVRATLEAHKQATQADVEPLAREAIQKWLWGKQVIKVIFVPGRLISFVVK